MHATSFFKTVHLGSSRIQEFKNPEFRNSGILELPNRSVNRHSMNGEKTSERLCDEAKPPRSSELIRERTLSKITLKNTFKENFDICLVFFDDNVPHPSR